MAVQVKTCWIFLTIISAVLTDREVLLDTTLLDNLGWTTFTRHSGWREASFTTSTGDGESQTYRVYAVCEVAEVGVDNWLRTPYIRRQNANRLYIETKFTMRECTRHPNPDVLQQCKEKFNLLYYEADSNIANSIMPTWDTQSYRHIDAIAADREFTDINNAAINIKTRDIPVMLNGVYFSFQDTGACISLISIQVYYIYCASITINFARFEKTVTGPEVTSIVQQTGVCVDNAAMESKPTYLCKADGTWYLNSGGCKCMAGFQPDTTKSAGTACIECEVGTYKWQVGSEGCQVCPEKSFAYYRRAVECKCMDGFYRALTDPPSTACARPPGPPRNISTRFVDQSMAIIQWLAPSDDGGRTDVYYTVECRGCSSQVRYTPSKTDLQQTRVTLAGLAPNTPYVVSIYARNGVSKVSNTEWDYYQTVEFTTDASVPSKVENVHIIERGANYLVIGWDKPSDTNTIEKYEVLFYITDEASNASTIETTALNYAFKGLKKLTRFGFQVRGKTTRGWGEYSSTLYASTISQDATDDSINTNSQVTKVDSKDDGNPVGIIAGAIVAVFVCLAIVIIIFVIIFRRNNPTCHEKSPTDCETLQYSNMNCGTMDNNMHMNGAMTLPLFHVPGTLRSYVDPHTYEDPNQAVREHTKEIDASHITIESVIGGGEFGDVCKGMLRLPGRHDMCVAIKTLKPGASEKNRLDFLTEASIMGQFEDPNVIFLEGVVTKSHPIMIVTEYMANGSLDTFLRNNDGQFTVLQLTAMLRGIAAGMKYLSEMGYVHRDLAARNILVNENLVCKVADFGLSREVEMETSDGAYTTKGGKIPVRWTAPEAIAYRKFTSSSDVWSYGVVMWEVMSYGERPYWNWSNQDVIKAVDKGYRLPPPMDCPEACHQLMLDCWQKERGHRPKFALLVLTLDKLIQAPELLHKLAQYRPQTIAEPPMPDMTSCQTVDDWLTSIRMDRYIHSFHATGYSTMQDVMKLTIKDLMNMGINLVGHQKRLMNSVQMLRARMNNGVQVSGGFLV